MYFCSTLCVGQTQSENNHKAKEVAEKGEIRVEEVPADPTAPDLLTEIRDALQKITSLAQGSDAKLVSTGRGGGYFIIAD